jgi:hypothetical protein
MTGKVAPHIVAAVMPPTHRVVEVKYLRSAHLDRKEVQKMFCVF